MVIDKKPAVAAVKSVADCTANLEAVTTVAPPDKAVVGAAETVNCVPFGIVAIVVPTANTPVPAVTETYIPTESPVVLPTVIVVVALVAPVAD